MSSISENLEKVKYNISEACRKSGRNLDDILLLGVTKTIDIERINELLNLGVKNLGENKVQELISKYDIIGDNADWHLIGHLQRNKVKYIIDKVKLIHSVDSFELAEEINKRALKNNKAMDILVEINIGAEESKNGIKPEDTEKFIDKISEFEYINVCGLMTVAPYVENPQNNRRCFEQMHNLFVDIHDKNKDNINMKFLSMGMTNDYSVAIEQGANIIRIGTGIFGARNYS